MPRTIGSGFVSASEVRKTEANGRDADTSSSRSGQRKSARQRYRGEEGEVNGRRCRTEKDLYRRERAEEEEQGM